MHQVEYSEIGASELTLSNGMRVCYKCTDFLDDQVQIYVGIAISVTKKDFCLDFVFLFKCPSTSFFWLLVNQNFLCSKVLLVGWAPIRDCDFKSCANLVTWGIVFFLSCLF